MPVTVLVLNGIKLFLIIPFVNCRFIVCLEVALLVMVAIAAASGFFQRSRASWVGLFSIATLLYIQMSNTYLAAEDTFKLGKVQDRSRTMTVSSKSMTRAHAYTRSLL